MGNKVSTVSLSDYILRIVCHIPWRPFNIQARLLHRFRHPEKTPDRRFAVPFFGLTYSGSLASEVDRYVFFTGSYEPDTLNVFQKILAAMDSPVAVDVGAHVGHHTMFFSVFASHVHSFEPFQTVREELLRHLEENNISNVTVHSVALGDRDESRTLYAPKAWKIGAGSFLSSHAENLNQPVEDVRIVNGDSYFQKNGIAKVDLIKIDVEGWEWFVILGLAKTIERCRPVILFEYSEGTRQSLQGRSHLLNVFTDYKTFSVRYSAPGTRNPLEPIEGESLPLGNLILIPSETVSLLLDRPDSRSLFSKEYRSTS